MGPLVGRIGGPLGSDLSVLLGFAAGGGVYLLLARRQVRAEALVAPARP